MYIGTRVRLKNPSCCILTNVYISTALIKTWTVSIVPKLLSRFPSRNTPPAPTSESPARGSSPEGDFLCPLFVSALPTACLRSSLGSELYINI